MKPTLVAGVYIERDRAMFLVATAVERAGRPALYFRTFSELKYDPSNPSEAEYALAVLAGKLGRLCPDLSHIGVACYGPFQSLNPATPLLTTVCPDRADLPFRGKRVAQFFRDETARHLPQGRPLFVLAETDANACVIGEAYARGIPDDHTLVFLLLTEGVGAGIVTGRTVFQSRLHPEIGLMHVRLHPKESLYPPEGAETYARSLSSVCANPSIERRRRFRTTDADIWNLRAYYAAQAALATAVILSPHKIVIAADIEPSAGDTVKRIRQEFSALMHRREKDRADPYVPSYLDPDFIESPEDVPGLGMESSIRATGAVGMCYAAAEAYWCGEIDNEQ